MRRLVSYFLSRYPYMSIAIASAGALRLALPVLVQAARAVADKTPTDADDKALEKILQSDEYKEFLSFLDMIKSLQA